MKKRVFSLCWILILVIVMVGCADKKPTTPQETKPQETVSAGENMYFVMPQNMANTADGWSAVPFEVYRYTGGEKYSLAYTFPDSDAYTIRVHGSKVYYAPLYGGKVTCVDLNSGVEQVLGELTLQSGSVYYLLADESKAFAICNKGKQNILYEVTAQNTKIICEDVVLQAELALGDGGLYYIDNADEMALMRYDLSSGESRKVADKVGVGDLEYDGGYVYSSSLDTLRYDVKTGESSFVASWSDYRVRDGWLYYTDYADDSADRDPALVEIKRRNLTDDRIESCGTAYIPYLGDLTLRRSIEFGEKGFIVYITFFKEDTKYMYFPYGASQGIELSMSNTGAAK